VLSRKIAILGGGAAGVVAANELAARGAAVSLFEREPHLGGLHRSVEIDGDSFDIGAFLFSSEHALITSFPEFASLFLPADAAHLSMTPRGTFDNYPISLGGYLRTYGLTHAGRSLWSLLAAKFRDRRCETVAKFAQYHMGRLLYHDTGLRHYIERLYGVPDTDIGIEFATQRLAYVRGFLGDLARATTRRMFDAPRESTGYLVRPREGFGYLYARIGELLEKRGVHIRVSCPISAIRKVASGYELHSASFTEKFDDVVSTLPLPVSLRLAGESVVSHAEHMGLLSLFYRGNFLPDAALIYNFTFEGRWKRVIVFSRYYGKSQGEDFLTVEVTGKNFSPERRRELAEDFEEHALRQGLFRTRPRLVGSVMTEHAYPFFRPGHTNNVRHEFERLGALGIRTVGRQGNHQYLSSSDTVEQAKALVSAIPVE
jgi:protoporphyrinogen oxidase